jgi:hypothetical protein
MDDYRAWCERNYQSISVMLVPSFDPLQVQALSDAFLAEQLDFLLIGKGAAILMGSPGTTQDVDVFLPEKPENSQKVVRALRNLGFALTELVGAKLSGAAHSGLVVAALTAISDLEIWNQSGQISRQSFSGIVGVLECFSTSEIVESCGRGCTL